MSVDQGHVPVEAILAKHTIVRAVYIAPVLIVGFGLLRGWEGAWASAIGILIVLGNFWLAGAILSVSFRIGLQAYHAAALISFFLRIAIRDVIGKLMKGVTSKRLPIRMKKKIAVRYGTYL